MSDTTTSSTAPQESVAWLAAYALGVAYSQSADQQRLTDLIAAARGCPVLLEAAHQRLDGADIAEPSIRDEARRLLDHARTHAGRQPPPAPGW